MYVYAGFCPSAIHEAEVDGSDDVLHLGCRTHLQAAQQSLQVVNVGLAVTLVVGVNSTRRFEPSTVASGSTLPIGFPHVTGIMDGGVPYPSAQRTR